MFGFGGPMGGLNGDPDYPDEYIDDRISLDDSYLYSKPDFKPFKPNKWWYHKKVSVKLVNKTDKAFLVENDKGKYWIPKTLLKFRKGKKARQYKKFKVKYL